MGKKAKAPSWVQENKTEQSATVILIITLHISLICLVSY